MAVIFRWFHDERGEWHFSSMSVDGHRVGYDGTGAGRCRNLVGKRLILLPKSLTAG